MTASAYEDHHDARQNCPEGSKVELHKVFEDIEGDKGYRWVVVAPAPKEVDAINWEDYADPIEGETEHEMMIREARRLLALRISRGAPDFMIDIQASRVKELLEGPAPAVQVRVAEPQGLTLGGAAAALAGGYMVGTMLRSGRGGHGGGIGHMVARAAVGAAVYSTVRPAVKSAFSGLFTR